MATFNMCNCFDQRTDDVVKYAGRKFTEFEELVQEGWENAKRNFSRLAAEVEAGLPLFLVGATSAFVEDNGFPAKSYDDMWSNGWYSAGRLAGHLAAMAQSMGEMAQGSGLIVAGAGGSILLAAPSCGTIVIPGSAVVATGAVEISHGALVGTHTVSNIINDWQKCFSKRDGGGGSGGSSGSGGGGGSGSGGGKPKPQKGVGGKGWRGDSNWKKAVSEVDKGGTIRNVNNQVPTKQEAIDLIQESGGKVQRIEGPHNPPNPHNFDHINYTTAKGTKGTIEIKGE